jgi:hypothetical protein
MTRHLICDVHEWNNEILTDPLYGLANIQQSERARFSQLVKMNLLSLTKVWCCGIPKEM